MYKWIAALLLTMASVILLIPVLSCGATNKVSGQADSPIQAMVSSVSQAQLMADVNGLTGNSMITVGGRGYTVTSRDTGSGTPIQKVTQWGYEQLQAAGLSVTYYNYNYQGYSSRAVIAQKTGRMKPTEIVIIASHIDASMPGADDNATGAAAVINAARIMSQYDFARTIRFVLFTGEEQYMLGSDCYVVGDAGGVNCVSAVSSENIVATIILDSIGHDSTGGPQMYAMTRTADPGKTSDTAIGNTICSAISTYSLPLTCSVSNDQKWQSDEVSFWVGNHPAVLMIEDAYACVCHRSAGCEFGLAVLG